MTINAETSTAALSDEDTGVSALLSTLGRVRQGELPPASLQRPLRAASLVVELDRSSAAVGEHQVVWVQTPQPLLPVFSELAQLAQWCLLRGDDEDDPVSYAHVTGAGLLDELLPQLPQGMGVVLDRASEHAFVIPGGEQHG